jgi:hypothetical protein
MGFLEWSGSHLIKGREHESTAVFSKEIVATLQVAD